ncbi:MULTISPECIES: sensor histidine kinase [unclassified Streptomyces]|uniref:sensor histidine kinase n=1 Tax=unclassified Streptomyces TaxID=2593676 RepID=UPI00380C1685
MDSSTRTVRQPVSGGVLGAVVGGRFAEALQEGLARAAQRPGLSAPVARPRHSADAPAPLTRRSVLTPVLLKGEGDAILDRFRAALPSALLPADREVPDLHAALVAFARHVLAHAEDFGALEGSAPPDLPPAGDASPHHLVAAASLLLECALMHVVENGAPHHDAVTVVRTLGDVMRTTGVPFWQGDHGWSERRRIARRLHDELGNALAVALHRIELSEDDPGAAAAHLAAAKKALGEAVRENRGLIGGLREQGHTPPVREAIEAFLADAAPTAQVTVAVTGDETAASERCRRELFLVLREALRNCFAHAGARHIEVTVRTTRRWLYARVEDDGTGFTGAPPADGAGHGLRSMTERVEDLGGRLRILGGPGGGTRIEIHLPLGTRL